MNAFRNYKFLLHRDVLHEDFDLRIVAIIFLRLKRRFIAGLTQGSVKI